MLLLQPRVKLERRWAVLIMITAVEMMMPEGVKEGEIDFDDVICTVTPEKKLSIDLAQGFWIILKTFVDGGCRKLLVNMENVSFLDSAGIGTLINIMKLIRHRGGDLALTGVAQDLIQILDMVNFRKFIKVFDTVDQAVKFFSDMQLK